MLRSSGRHRFVERFGRGRRLRLSRYEHQRRLALGVSAHHWRRAVASAPAASAASLAGGGQTGNASFYRGGGRTAAGGFVGAATCAHRTLPFGTKVLVTNLRSGLQAVLTVNDRGPFVRGRIVDVSVGAASRLGMIGSGTAPVRVQVIASRNVEAPLQ